MPNPTFAPEQTCAKMDFLSALSFNQCQLCVGLFKTAAQDRSNKDAAAVIRAVRKELYARTARALSEQEGSAYAVSISLTVSMEASCTEYAQNCLTRYRPPVSARQANPGRRAA